MRLIYLALGWILGILYAASDPFVIPLLWGMLALGSLLAALLSRRFIFLVFATAALGILRFDSLSPTSDIARFNDTDFLILEGVIATEPDQRDTSTQLRIQVDNVWQSDVVYDTSGTVLVFAPPTFDGRYGDRVRAAGELETPSVSDRFSYADYLARAGIYSIMPRGNMTLLEPAAGSDFRSVLIDLKSKAETLIISTLPEPQASLLSGILLGDDRGLPPEVRDAFAETGAAHIIAISGFNMAVLGGFITQLLKRLRVPPLPNALISITIIVLYTIFVGASPAVIRAAFMTSLAFFGAALRRKSYTPTSLAFAALVLTTLDPLTLWDVGFQLSFFAVLGLSLFSEPLTRLYDRIFGNLPSAVKPISEFLRESLTVGVAALAFTLPLSALYFGRVSPVVLIVNALIVPVQPVLMLLGGFAVLVGLLLPQLAQILFWADWLLLSWSISIVRLFAQLPDTVVYPSAQLIAIIFSGIIGAALLRAARPRWLENIMSGSHLRRIMLVLTAAAAMLFVLAVILWRSRPDGLLHLWFFDMGSTSTLIQTPNGAHMLIDGGAYPSRLLTALGDRMPLNDQTLEVQFITQPDDALISALTVLYERYQASQIIVNGSISGTDVLDAVNQVIEPFPQTSAITGQSIQTDDGLTIRVEQAAGSINETSASAENEADALVLRLIYGDVSILLTGALSIDGQEALLRNRSALPVTLLQIPRSGRKDSLAEGFLETFAPQIALVQLDALSRRVTPDQGILEQVGTTPLYRTDLHGTIHIYTDGKTLQIEVERISAE